MESTSIAGPTDRLSTLPIELLEWIFELAYEGEDTTTGPISRALVPFDRRERFKHVEVKSTDQFRRLVLLLDQHSLHKSVDSLACAGIEDSLAAPKEQEIKSFLQRLSRLKSLSLTSECAPLRRVIFSAFYARVHPSSLTSLALTPSTSWTVPWDPSNFSRLATFLTLSRLELHFDSPPQEFAPQSTQTRTPPKVELPQVKQLILKGKNLDFPALADLPDASRLLLKSRSLYLLFPEQFCDDQLRRFSKLQELSIGPVLFDPDTLPINLAALPFLSSLTFNEGVQLPLSYFTAFISGPSRLAPLKRLGLDLVKAGKRGWRIRKEGNGRLHPDHYLSPEHVAPDWDVPLLSKEVTSVTYKDVEELVRIAKENGVEVSGTAVEAVKLRRARRAEALECLLAYGKEVSDYGKLQAFVRGGGKEETS